MHTGDGLITQDAVDANGRNVPDQAEDGDGFGSSVTVDATYRLLIGTPGEDLPKTSGEQDVDAGLVQVIDEEPGPPGDGNWFATGPAINQSTSGVPGARAAGNRFGAALGTYSPATSPYVSWFYIGAPGADIGSARDAGLVLTWRSDGRWLAFSDATYGGTPETGDRFGEYIATQQTWDSTIRANADLVAFGSPGENGVGSLRGVAGFPKTNWMLASGPRRSGDAYGTSAASGLARETTGSCR